MVRFPEGFRVEVLSKDHERERFESGQASVDAWLRERALQNQRKRLSVTRVLVASDDSIAGYYTTAMGQVDFSDLPEVHTRKLPRRALPLAVLAWLGVDHKYQGKGLGDRLLADALAVLHQASSSFAFVAVVLDCVDDAAKRFYERWDFREVPGRPMRLFIAAEQLDALMKG